ncbi:MAG TPA: methyltransferase domain-containing protein [Steroidobacteraceae bacterium]
MKRKTPATPQRTALKPPNTALHTSGKGPPPPPAGVSTPSGTTLRPSATVLAASSPSVTLLAPPAPSPQTRAGTWVKRLFAAYSQRARARRARLFRERFTLTETTRILDLGSETGAAIRAVLEGTAVRPGNVYIADIRPEVVIGGARRYGFMPVVVPESGALPFPDGFFDIVHCSSVIEHVTLPKEAVWRVTSGKQFRREAWVRQQQFAAEIRRLGRQFFVQTPYKHFPLESHSWLPFVAWLPRGMLVRLFRLTNRFWVKKTAPDWNLLGRTQLAQLFPEARIVTERSFGMTKSLMAVKTNQT